MKRTLLALKTIRVRLLLLESTLESDRDAAPIDRKAAVVADICRNKAELSSVEKQIEVAELNIQWDDSNVANVPVTVILGDV